jgi:hypothetical protein
MRKQESKHLEICKLSRLPVLQTKGLSRFLIASEQINFGAKMGAKGRLSERVSELCRPVIPRRLYHMVTELSSANS